MLKKPYNVAKAIKQDFDHKLMKKYQFKQHILNSSYLDIDI
jgi:hypothetical protein